MRAAVAGDLERDLMVATPDQDRGDQRTDGAPSGNGGEMLLALGLGDFDQVGIAQEVRLLKHRTRDFDVVVAGEVADDIGRRIADRRELGAEFGQRLGFDVRNKPHHDIVEDRDMIFRKRTRAVQEQVGHLAQHRAALGVRPLAERGFNFGGPHVECCHRGITSRTFPGCQGMQQKLQILCGDPHACRKRRLNLTAALDCRA